MRLLAAARVWPRRSQRRSRLHSSERRLAACGLQPPGRARAL